MKDKKSLFGNFAYWEGMSTNVEPVVENVF